MNSLGNDIRMHKNYLLVQGYTDYYKNHPNEAHDATVFRLNPRCFVDDRVMVNEWSKRSFKDFDMAMRDGRFKFFVKADTGRRYLNGKFGGRKTIVSGGYVFKSKSRHGFVGGRDATIELFSKVLDDVELPDNKQYLVVLSPHSLERKTKYPVVDISRENYFARNKYKCLGR